MRENEMNLSAEKKNNFLNSFRNLTNKVSYDPSIDNYEKNYPKNYEKNYEKNVESTTTTGAASGSVVPDEVAISSSNFMIGVSSSPQTLKHSSLVMKPSVSVPLPHNLNNYDNNIPEKKKKKKKKVLC
eukprot:Trichotokara_eunicae@DN6507_c0_g1_i1.p2